ncbi:hypothetical protein SGFS_022370 [Streptomyces graminofaciens]|uniref:Pectinesterase n=2 Tax=Streptomyces graminofaciens TaxID=68212 RepID=A0ABN5VFA8_9ACTN|nr:hypothetical protein SGFS_022370 [Streptomyces graminofaciens]
MRDGLPRRSFIAAMVAAGVVAGGLVVVGAPSASAATDATITWRNTSEPADARNGYAALINAIKAAIRAGRVRSEDSAPLVDVTDSAGTTYITIDLHAEDRPEFIRVIMRRENSYVMGWFQGTENGVGNVVLGDFFPLEAGLQNGQGGIPQGRPAGTLSASDPGSRTNTRFDTLAGYDALSGQGARRDGMQISPASLNNAVLQLQTGDSVPVANAAPAILQVIVALAEGNRYRDQATATATAFGQGVPFTLTAQHIAQHNSWSVLSTAFLGAVVAGAILLSAPIEVGAVVFATTYAVAQVLMTAKHSNLNTKGRHLTVVTDNVLHVQPNEFGDYPTVQAAIDAAPTDGVQRTIYLAKGTYNEVITVPTGTRDLFIKGATGNAADVVITGDRAHGMINPATGAPYGTEGSAVATFKAPGITVANLTIQNTFDPKAHPEISPYDTQAVAVAAKGDRQTFTQCRIIGRQDTILVKAPVATGQYRQYFVGCYIEGAIDFIFGNATAVIDRCNIALRNWVGGTVLAPNTDQSKTYGILITGSTIYTNGVPANTMYLGRPWHNGSTVSPQAVIRNTVVNSGITAAHPWTDMTTDYSWTQARFKEYKNTGAGAGVGANAPQMSDSEAANYTGQKYLAGTDGWNPIW